MASSLVRLLARKVSTSDSSVRTRDCVPNANIVLNTLFSTLRLHTHGIAYETTNQEPQNGPALITTHMRQVPSKWRQYCKG
jgi:hypothetical protein